MVGGVRTGIRLGKSDRKRVSAALLVECPRFRRASLRGVAGKVNRSLPIRSAHNQRLRTGCWVQPVAILEAAIGGADVD